MEPKEHRRHHTDKKGEYLIVEGRVESVDAAIDRRDEIEDGPEPAGYHYWMGKAQRSSRGTSGQYVVWYRKTRVGANWR